MNKNSIKIILVSGLLLLSLNIALSLIFNLFFDQIRIAILELPLNLILYFLAGYIGFKYTKKYQNILMDPFLIGTSIGLVAWGMSVLIFYLISHQIQAGGLYFIFISGFGSKIAFKNQNKYIDKIIKVLFFIVLLVLSIPILFFTFNFFSNKSSIENLPSQGNLQTYKDTKFGY